MSSSVLLLLCRARSWRGGWRVGLQKLRVDRRVPLSDPPFVPSLLVALEIVLRHARQRGTCPKTRVLVAVVHQANQQRDGFRRLLASERGDGHPFGAAIVILIV